MKNARLGSSRPEFRAFLTLSFLLLCTTLTAYAQPAAVDSLNASFDAYEDRVELAWYIASDSLAEGTRFEVRRVEVGSADTTLINLAASDVRTYTDASADVLVRYSYCIVAVDGTGASSSEVCDQGRRAFWTPTDFVASDASDVDVSLSWMDNTNNEEGYKVYRADSTGLSFNGLTQYVTIPNETSFDFADSLTVEFWVKWTYPYGAFNHDTHISKGNSWLLQRKHFSSSNLTFTVFQGASPVELISNTPLNDDEWHHVAAVYDGAALSLYIDGQLDASMPLTGSIDTNNHPVWIGSNIQDTISYFEGILDEVRIWSEPRTEKQIQDNMLGLLTGSETNLAGYWRFDDGTGTTATDTGGSNNGTLVGMDNTNWVPGGQPQLLTTLGANASSYLDTSVTQATPYLYCAAAYTGNTHSLLACDEGISPTLAPTTNVQATDGTYTDRIVVTWDDNSQIEDGYIIYKLPLLGEGEIIVDTVAANVTSFADSVGLDPMVDWYAYIVATIKGSDTTYIPGDDSPFDQNFDYGSHRKLPPPNNVEVSFDLFDDRVELSWAYDEATNPVEEIPEGLPWRNLAHIDRFEVLRDGTPIDTISTSNPFSKTDFSATPGATYNYCVVAVAEPADAIGPARSDSVCANGRVAGVIAPSNVTASNGDYEDRVELTWESSSTSVLLFNVYRGVGTTDIASMDVVGTSPFDLFAYTDEMLESDVEYDYCVTAMSLLSSSKNGSDPTSVQEALGQYLRVESARTLPSMDMEAYKAHALSVQEGAQNLLTSQGMTDVVESAPVCTKGGRSLNPPSGIAMTFDDHEDHVEVSWVDNSSAEKGYRIYRILPTLSFDGVNDRIEVPSANQIQQLDIPARTVEAWFYVDDASINSRKQVIWDQGGNDFSLGSLNIYVYDGKLYSFATSGNWPTPLIISTTNVQSKTWHHVAIVFDGATQTLTGYLDGVVFASHHNGNATHILGTNDLNTIGGVRSLSSTMGTIFHDGPANNNTNHFKGFIRDVRVWNAARSGSEIRRNKARSLDGGETDLIAWWPLNEAGGTTAFDQDDDTADASGTHNAPIIGAIWDPGKALAGEVAASRSSFGDYMGFPDITYTYRVHAYDIYATNPDTLTSESKQGSYAVSTDTTGRRTLFPPSNLQASDGESETDVVLTWTDHSRAEDGYYILRDGIILDTLGVNAVTYTDNPPAVGVVHSYGVQAFDAYGVSLSEEDDGGTVVLPPSSVNASDTYTNKVVVAWIDASNLETGYKVWRDDLVDNRVGSGASLLITLGVGATTHTDNSSAPNTVYEYCVQAISGSAESVPMCDSGGELPSPGSDVINVALNAPTSVVASDGLYDDRVQITWIDQTGAAEDGYNVYRRDADGVLQLVGSTGANGTSFNDFGAGAGGGYEYCVRAFQTGVAGQSATGCEHGWVPSNGVISGGVTTLSGSGTKDVEIRLTPNPNGSLLFDGVGGYVQTSALDLSGDEITIEYWFKGSSSQSAVRQQSSGADYIISGWGNKHILSNDGGTAGGVKVSPSNEHLDGEWHHIAMTWKRNTTKGFISYLDGQKVESKNSVDVALPTLGVPVVLGSYLIGSVGSEFTNGMLDEVRIWNIVRDSLDIPSTMNTPLTGNEDGLVAYWSLDQSSRRIAPEMTGSGANGLLKDGVHWAEGTDQLQVNAVTDIAGNYTFSGLRYDQGTTFKVTPYREGRIFNPVFKTITLSTDNPVQNEVDFIDNSAFTVAGRVLFDGTVCPVQNVEFSIEDVLTQTVTLGGASEVDGSFAISVEPADLSLGTTDRRRILPAFGENEDAHIFEPDFFEYLPVQDTSGVIFYDKQLTVLTGYFGGGGETCNKDIGDATLKITTADGCFLHELALTQPGEFAVQLPPQEYLVSLEVNPSSIPSGLDKADIIEFFDNLGTQAIDLTAQSDTLDMAYRAPLKVSVSGFESGALQCSSGITHGGTTLPGAAIITEAEAARGVNLTIDVLEDYGASGTCPLEGGDITIFDNISDRDEAIVFEDITGGSVNYTLNPGLPDVFTGRSVDGINRSFQKSLTVLADVQGRESVTQTEWAIVEGTRPRTGTFVTAASNPTPWYILHDPPGDNSYSYIEKGSTICIGFEYESAFLVGLETGISTDVGVELIKGFGVSSVTRAVNGVDIVIDIGAGGVYEGGETVCLTNEQAITTSADPTFVGPVADVFIGGGFNFLFAEAETVDVTESCVLTVDDGLAAGIDPTNPISTTYNYSRSYITGTHSNKLKDLLGDYNATFDTNGDPTSCASAVSFDPTQTDAEAKQVCNKLLSGFNNFKGLIAYDSTLTKPENFSLQENISYEAGAKVSRSTRWDSTGFEASGSQYTFEFSLGHEFDFKESGSGVEVSLKGYTAFEGMNVFTKEQESFFTVGFEMDDDDPSDHVSVDVGRGTPTLPDCTLGSGSSHPWCQDEKTTRMPTLMAGSELVFKVRSGRTSSPWEPWYLDDGTPATQTRDRAKLEINGSKIISGIPADGTAVVPLTLTNDGDSREIREYYLRAVHKSNPGGAVMRANGSTIHEGLSFFIDGGQSQEVTLSVERGPTRYSYDSLAVQLYPAVEYPIWHDGGLGGNGKILLADTVYFSVNFNAPCSEISALRPKENWVFNADSTSLDVILNNFVIPVSETDTVSTLGLEYRFVGTSDWLPAVTTTRSGLGDDTATSWNTTWTPMHDGIYETRAYTKCASGDKVVSDVFLGVVDREDPVVFGTPEPSDGSLGLGDDAIVTFNEELDCDSIDDVDGSSNLNVQLIPINTNGSEGTPLTSITATCNGRSVALAPSNGWDSSHEGKRYRAKLLSGSDGATDLYGNDFGSDVEWDFLVQRAGFDFNPVNLVATATRGVGHTLETSLANGQASNISFAINDSLLLELLDSSGVGTGTTVLLPPSDSVGVIQSGGAYPIQFSVPDTLAVGTWRGQISANGKQGSKDLGNVTFFTDVNVACEAPNWFVNASAFEHTMSLTTQLYTSGLASTDENDLVAAFVNGQVRGVAQNMAIGGGSYRVSMLLYSNDPGEVVTFQVWDDDTCTLHQETSLAITFVSNGSQGNPAQPTTLQAPPPATTDIPLAAGWTWFSINTVPVDATVATLFAGMGSVGDQVKTQVPFSTYDETFGWFGSLTSINAGVGYLAYLSRSGHLDAGSTPVPFNTAIPVSAGWNWIGYQPQAAQALDGAFNASYTFQTNDLIKSQFAFAQYDGTNWVGSLTQLEPGQGYLINLAGAGSLVYNNSTPSMMAKVSEEDLPDAIAQRLDGGKATPTHNPAASKDLETSVQELVSRASTPLLLDECLLGEEADLLMIDAERTLIPGDFTHTMTLTAELDYKQSLASEPVCITMRAGQELRAIGQLQYVASTKKHLAFLTIYGKETGGEALTLDVHHADWTTPMAQATGFTFEPNAVLGTPSNPEVIRLEQSDEVVSSFVLEQNYPNPFNPQTSIRYALPAPGVVEIALYDVLGRQVSLLIEGEHKAGWHQIELDASRMGLASGLYFYRMKGAGFQETRKMMLLK